MWRRAGLVFLALLAAGCRRAPPASQPAARYISGVDAGYVDPAACAGCHKDIAETYRRTGMGRSFDRPRVENTPEGAYFHRASDRHYRIYRRDGKFYQRRHQLGPDGSEINVFEKEIHYVIGSGNHARTYLNRSADGKIVELPVAWYSAGGGSLAMNPGYDRPDHQDFRRRISHECMFCHNAYPEIAPGADASGRPPVFPERLPDGIDCQRCHGPGREHLRAAGAKGATTESIRGSIVNPARLSAERQLELCMQCHLETTSFRLPHSIVRFDRGAFSYRAGEPLGDYVLHFDHPTGAGYDDKFEIAHHAYRLRKSACFQKSGGRMTCTTCHNPHQALRGDEATRRYTAACRGCHTSAHSPAPDCLGCHMPKRRTDDVVHVVMTDHYIQRRKPTRNLLAARRERHDTEATAYNGEVALYYPPSGVDELYLATAQVKQLANLAGGIPRLRAAIERHRPQRPEFFFELAEAYWESKQPEQAIAMYEEALRRKPDYWPALHHLGTALGKSGQLTRAADALEKAAAVEPGDATTWNDLALVYVRLGRSQDAAAALRKALAADPDLPDAWNNLGGALGELGRGAEAEAAYREAIRSQPDFAAAHKNLANTLAGRGDFPAAQYYYETAIRLDPRQAASRYDYGLALARNERFDLARPQFEAAAKLDPSLAEAHNALGDLSAMRGETGAAIAHYRKAIAARPDYQGAHQNLAQALAASGQDSEARRRVEKAAGASRR